MSNFLIEEYNQAWEHYRHIENARSKYMNFFYTALFAVTTASYIVFKDAAGNEKMVSFYIILVLFHFMNIFNMYIYLNVRKFGLTLRHYEHTINRVRKIKVGSSYSKMLDIRSDTIMRTRWLSVQTSAQAILILIMLISNTAIIGFTLYYVDNCAIRAGSIIVCLLILSAQMIGVLKKV